MTLKLALHMSLLLVMAFTLPPAGDAHAGTQNPATGDTVFVHALPDIQSWGYQLQNIDPVEIARAPVDLIVIDYSRDGTGKAAFSRAEIKAMQKSNHGGRRLVLAYFSIGEAENYRDYWQKSWATKPPTWLMRENPEWPGNYPVRYWQPQWQEIIQTYLAAIIDAGFDGVYLDRVDVFETFPRRATAQADMITLVKSIASYGVTRNENFLVIAQNAESLLRHEHYRRLISAIAKEDLLFGLDGDGRANSKKEIRWSRKHLDIAKKQRLPVLVIEYLKDPRTIAKTRKKLRKFGYIPTFSSRELDRLSNTSAPQN